MEDAGVSKLAETLSLLKFKDDTTISDAVELDGQEKIPKEAPVEKKNLS